MGRQASNIHFRIIKLLIQKLPLGLKYRGNTEEGDIVVSNYGEIHPGLTGHQIRGYRVTHNITKNVKIKFSVEVKSVSPVLDWFKMYIYTKGDENV